MLRHVREVRVDAIVGHDDVGGADDGNELVGHSSGAQLGRMRTLRNSRTIDPVASCNSGSTSPSTTTIVSRLMPFSTAIRPRPTRTVAAVRPARIPTAIERGSPSTAKRTTAFARYDGAAAASRCT